MSFKSWMLDRVHRGGGMFGRDDLPRREPGLAQSGRAAEHSPHQSPHQSPHKAPDNALAAAEHLGAYAALIGAIRDELEHFVASHVRLHLAIAERDRFLLTGVSVSCPDSTDARMLLQRFMREFKPEQVKRYLAREVIGALPNAAAIDLTQFAGLIDADAKKPAEESEDSEYAELLAALRSSPPAAMPRAYQVHIVGRWSEIDASGAVSTAPGVHARTHAMRASSVQAGATPSMLASGTRCDFDIEDGDGRRRVVLQSVVPGRRYVIGKGEGCDIRVNGTYTSRRHGEVWLDSGGWHVSDAGSTNGIRVETPGGAIQRSAGAVGDGDEPALALALASGARVVLSAQAEGTPGDYPSLALRTQASDLGARVTPIAGTLAAKTPVTSVRAGHAASTLLLTSRGVTGVRTVELLPGAPPLQVGRSRTQDLVVGRAHELVSGHHLDISAADDSGAQVVVHGDNGVSVDGIPYAVGSRFIWKVGQTMVLGAVQQDGRACMLSLSRRGDT